MARVDGKIPEIGPAIEVVLHRIAETGFPRSRE